MKKLQWQGSTKRWVAVLCAAVGAVALLIAANKVLAAPKCADYDQCHGCGEANFMGCCGQIGEEKGPGACVACCGISATCKAKCPS